MIKRAIVPAIAFCIVAIAAVACGTSSDAPAAPDTPIIPDTEAAPTTSSDPPPGLGRNSRFVPLDNPEVVSADEATFLQPDDRVLGLTVGGESRAYPISMMTFHHVANDILGGLPVLVTF